MSPVAYLSVVPDTESLMAPARLVPLCLLLAGCAGADAAPGWQAVRDTIGDTVVVRTVAGSIWGASRVLQEDLSIGVEEGAPEEMFGDLRSIAVAPDGAIYVMDPEPALRKFDRTGRFVGTIGRLGSGPGEYRSPDGGLVVLRDGRVVIRDPGNGRLQLVTSDGKPAGQWPLESGFFTSRRLGRDTTDNVYTLVVLESQPDPMNWRIGLRRYAPDGTERDTIPVPEWQVERMQITGQHEGNRSISGVPFSPLAHWDWSPFGYFVGGASDRYRIDLLRPGGVLRLERDVPSVAVDPAESAAKKAEATEQMRRNFPDWTWNGPEIPSTKPWFRRLYVGGDGRIWVWRSQPGVVADESGEWTEPTLFDVYEPDGRFLGESRGPDGFREWPEPVFAGDTVWAAVESAEGVLRVKRLVARAPRAD